MKAPPTNRFLLHNQDLKAKAVITSDYILTFKELNEKVWNTNSILFYI